MSTSHICNTTTIGQCTVQQAPHNLSVSCLLVEASISYPGPRHNTITIKEVAKHGQVIRFTEHIQRIMKFNKLCKRVNRSTRSSVINIAQNLNFDAGGKVLLNPQNKCFKEYKFFFKVQKFPLYHHLAKHIASILMQGAKLPFIFRKSASRMVPLDHHLAK